MRRLEGRVALVTGAASGIGEALVQALARRGCELALVDRDASGLERVGAELATLGRRVSAHVCDLADAAAIAELPARVRAAHDRVHLVASNAGITAGGFFSDQPLADVERVLGVNFLAGVRLCHAFLPLLLAQDEASVILVASPLAGLPTPFQAAYCASKAAIASLGQTLALELGATPVRVTTVFPGMVRTRIIESAAFTDGEARHRFARLLARRGLPPRAVAERVVRAICRGQRQVTIGWDAHLVGLVTRVFPSLPLLLLARAARVAWRDAHPPT